MRIIETETLHYIPLGHPCHLQACELINLPFSCCLISDLADAKRTTIVYLSALTDTLLLQPQLSPSNGLIWLAIVIKTRVNLSFHCIGPAMGKT